jgi:biopolymer transport protein ExbB
MTDLITKGGILMIPIIFCSVIALAIFSERLIHLYRMSRRGKDIEFKVIALLKQGKVAEAIKKAEESDSPMGRIIEAALEALDDAEKETIEAVILNAIDKEVRGLSSNIQALATIGNIAPLLGLLGTVIGMIKAFMVIQDMGGKVNAAVLAGGIWEAMLTTAFGLVVALPVMMAHSWLIASIDKYEARLQDGSLAIMQQLTSKNNRKKESL